MSRRRGAARLIAWGGALAGAVAAAAGSARAQSAAPIAITHVTVVDVAAGRRLPDRTVLVRGDTVVRVGPAAAVRVPAGARVVDGRGGFLIPGLWDMGSLTLQGVRTTAPGALGLLLAHGVTGTRDLNTAMPLDSVAHLARELATGARLGPRLLWTGQALQQSYPAASPNFLRADRLPDALAYVTRLADAGAHHVRLVQGVREGDVPALVAAARARGLPATIAPVFRWADAAAMGVAGVEHFTDLTRTTARRPWRDRYLALYRGAGPRLPREQVQPFLDSLHGLSDAAERGAALRALAQRRVPVTTNMASMFWAQAMLRDRYAARARWVRAEPPAGPPPGASASRASAEGNWRDVRDLHAAGVPLLAGSLGGQGLAAVPGAALHDELELLVRAGLTPRAALAAATVTPAAVIARTYPRIRAAGAVAEGQPADLVLLDGDPLADIANVRRVRAVVAAGRLIDAGARATLLANAVAGADSADAHEAAARFLEAFDAMDDARFAAAWAADASVFLPDAGAPTRVEGRDAVLAYFRAMFADTRRRGRSTLATRARVRGLRVALLAPGAAVVTFHLGDDASPGRRTAVFRRDADAGWRLVHLHASRLTPPAGPSPAGPSPAPPGPAAP